VLSLEMDQESSGIELMYVCVCEGGEGRLGCGCILLYSILYVTSVLLVPSLCTTSNILLLVFYLLWSKSYMLYSILYLVATIFNIVYVHSIYMLLYVLDSKFCILHMLHILTAIVFCSLKSYKVLMETPHTIVTPYGLSVRRSGCACRPRMEKSHSC